MKSKSRLIALCLCGQLISSCGQTAHPPREPQDSGKESPHKVVQVDWPALLADIQKRLTKDPNSAFLHNQAAVAYDALGDFGNFDREINIAMKLEPDKSIHCYMAYAVYKRRHFRDKQISVLEKALQIDPGNPMGHYEKAGIFEDDKKWADALAEYQTTKRLLEWVKADQKNFHNNNWTYLDRRGNPYDVSSEITHIEEDMHRVRAAMQNQN